MTESWQGKFCEMRAIVSRGERLINRPCHRISKWPMAQPTIKTRTSPLTFRVVTSEDDIPALVMLAREAHEESRFSSIPFDSVKVADITRKVIKDDKRHCIFIAEKDRRAIAFAYCTAGEYHIGNRDIIVTINNINVSRKFRQNLNGGKAAMGIFTGIRSWAKAREAREILLHVTSGVKLASTHKMAKKLGFTLIGASYSKTLR